MVVGRPRLREHRGLGRDADGEDASVGGVGDFVAHALVFELVAGAGDAAELAQDESGEGLVVLFLGEADSKGFVDLVDPGGRVDL
jgi:hypothetical protein